MNCQVTKKMWKFKQRKKTKVQLVLGSGGARGLAHIGVIEMLEEEGYEIVEVVGCSMGAVIGGVYCAGYLDIYKEWLLTLTRSQIFNLMDFTLPNLGFLKGEKVLGKMRTILGDQRIETLKIPFTAVATDMVKGKEVLFTEGDLYAAIRASMSIPGVFTPVIQGDALLVDGAVLNPLPLNLLKKRRDSIVVAVNLNGLDVKETVMADEPIDPLEIEQKNWWMKWMHSPKIPSEPHPPRYSMFELMSNSYYLTQDRLVAMTVKIYPPDIVVDIPYDACQLFDFHKGEHMIGLGRSLYKKAKLSSRIA